MKKNFFIIALALLLGLSLYGCGNNAQNASSVNSANKTKAKKATTKVIEKAASFDKNVKMKAANGSVPVLMYHSVADGTTNPVVIAPAKLDEELKYLKDNGYYTISLDDLYAYFTNNTPIPEKAVVLTFDDGYKDNYTNMFPILKKYGFKATVFVITSYINKLPGYLTSKQLKEMQAYGVDIESHTVDHKPLNTLTKAQQLVELADSKAFIEKLLNKKVNYIAYPDGSYNKDTVECAKEAGYTMAFTTDGRWSSKSNGLYTLYRDYINGQFDMNTFIQRITNPNYKF